MKARLFYLAAALLLLAACGPAAQEATATPAATPTAVSGPRATATQPPAVQPTTAPATQATATPKPVATAAPSGIKPKRGGTLTFNLRGDPQKFDPWVRGNWDVYDPYSYVHARLTRVSSSSEPCELDPPEPELATAWKWLDDRTLEIALRQGVRYPPGPPFNGREFTAEDLVYTATVQWKRSNLVLTPQVKLKSVEAIDRYTARFNLEEPFADFAEALLENGRAPVAGPELFDKDNSVNVAEQAALGPFRVVKYRPGVAIDFLRNDAYWRKEIPYVDGLKGLIMPDFALAVAAVRSGKLDFAELKGQMQAGIELEKSNPDLGIVWCEGLSSHSLILPPDEPPFDDVRVRRAIAMAIDAEAIAKLNWGNKGLLGPGVIDPKHPTIVLKKEDYPPEIRQYLEFHPDRSRTLLQEAGKTQGLEFTINLPVTYRDMKNGAELMVEALDKVGIKVKLNVQEWGAFTATTRLGKYKGAMIYFTISGTDMKSGLLSIHSSTPLTSNFNRIKDPTLDALLEEFERTLEPEKRKEVAKRIQLRYADQAYGVGIGVGLDPQVRQPWVKGIPPKFRSFIMGDYVMHAWLDK
ncbi:MAG: ABC transporter substrate-binding protein [Chloroflexi bacterium]|nr:ABC transporter substrate-binding protein [Chloroflexota bacterium]